MTFSKWGATRNLILRKWPSIGNFESTKEWPLLVLPVHHKSQSQIIPIHPVHNSFFSQTTWPMLRSSSVTLEALTTAICIIIKFPLLLIHHRYQKSSMISNESTLLPQLLILLLLLLPMEAPFHLEMSFFDFYPPLLCICSISIPPPPKVWSDVMWRSGPLSDQRLSKRLSLYHWYTCSSSLVPATYIVCSLLVNMFTQYSATKATETMIDVIFVPFHWTKQRNDITFTLQNLEAS